jgi:hypothetical protein
MTATEILDVLLKSRGWLRVTRDACDILGR